jgi:hypothetical protein
MGLKLGLSRKGITQIHGVRKENAQENEKVKVKVKLFLCLNKHHAVKAYWESGGITPLIL